MGCKGLYMFTDILVSRLTANATSTNTRTLTVRLKKQWQIHCFLALSVINKPKEDLENVEWNYFGDYLEKNFKNLKQICISVNFLDIFLFVSCCSLFIQIIILVVENLNSYSLVCWIALSVVNCTVNNW